MKKRIITGIVLALLVTPFILFGGYLSAVFVGILMIAGIYEFLNVFKKANQEAIPIYVYILSFVFSFLMVFGIPMLGDAFNYKEGSLSQYNLNIIWVSSFLLVLFASSVFDKKFSIMNAFYTFTTTTYLSMGLKALLFLRTFTTQDVEGLYLVVFVLLVTCMSDIFAYFTGMSCYKLLGSEKVHKLNERISPKKTIEGSLGGTILATLAGTIFCVFAFKNTITFHFPFYVYMIISFFMSIFGQIGDLSLSAIKRFFNIKDYSNLLPGHGGVLDRLDSLIISLICMAISINILAYIG